MAKYLLVLSFEGFDELSDERVKSYLPIKLYDNLEEPLEFIKRNLDIDYSNNWGPQSANRHRSLTKKENIERYVKDYGNESDYLEIFVTSRHAILEMDEEGEFDIDSPILLKDFVGSPYYVESFWTQKDPETGQNVFKESDYSANKAGVKKEAVTNTWTLTMPVHTDPWATIFATPTEPQETTEDDAITDIPL